jgi:AmmeMemoRadiSam system protein B
METDRVRRPCVAGSFYPDRPEAMAAQLDRLVTPSRTAIRPRALVVPHAGWVYSGRVAGAVYGRVELPHHVVILGPNHTGRGPAGSVMVHGRWRLPGGELPIAETLAQSIASASRVLEADELAHEREHAIEVQLPFLRRLRSDLAFVPITLMEDDPVFCEEVGGAVAAALQSSAERALLVCSTDLNHHESQGISNRKDRLAIDAMLGLDPGRLRETVKSQEISMCGLAPAQATLAALHRLGGGRAELVRYETSGDVSGNYDRVTGYAGIVIHKPDPPCDAGCQPPGRGL